MKTSQAGIDLIKHFEGFRSKPYVCKGGKLTIGYGHVIRPGENFTEISRQTAENILAKDLEYFEKQVLKVVTVPLNQGQFDALVSFAFNLGIGNLRKSTLLKKLNAGDYEAAANEFGKWVRAKGVKLAGLIKRRSVEQQLFQNGEISYV